jgi:hypothetical protein
MPEALDGTYRYLGVPSGRPDVSFSAASLGVTGAHSRGDKRASLATAEVPFGMRRVEWIGVVRWLRSVWGSSVGAS